MVKKISALFLALVLCLSVMVVPVSAAPTISGTAGVGLAFEYLDGEGNALTSISPGQEVTVNIYATVAAEGEALKAAKFQIWFNNEQYEYVADSAKWVGPKDYLADNSSTAVITSGTVYNNVTNAMTTDEKAYGWNAALYMQFILDGTVAGSYLIKENETTPMATAKFKLKDSVTIGTAAPIGAPLSSIYARTRATYNYVQTTNIKAPTSTDGVTLATPGNDFVAKVPKCETCTEDNGTVTKPATCAEAGEMLYTCTVCGATRTETVPATGNHTAGDPVDENVVPASCNTAGSKDVVVKCSVCDFEMSRTTETIPATGEHNYATKKVVAEATCTEAGSYVMVCGCGTEDTPVTVDALGHDFSEVDAEAVAPTCTDAGSTAVMGCSRCDATEGGEEVPATDHNMVAGEVVAPTCTTAGYTVYTCANNCGTTENRDEVEATDHDYESVVTAPTCTTAGYTTYTCSACGDTYTADEVEATEHDYESVVTAPTCTDAGYTTYTCSVCGDTYTADAVDALGHEYEVTFVKQPTCAKEGYTRYTCPVCKESKEEPIPSKNHTNDDGTSALVEIPAVPATCKTTGYTAGERCTLCNAQTIVPTLVPRTEHNWDEGVVTEPTYSSQGYTLYTCVDCSETKKEYIPALPVNFTFEIAAPSVTTLRARDTIILHPVFTGEVAEGVTVEWSVDNENFKIVEVYEDGSVKVQAKKVVKGTDGITAFTATAVDAEGNDIVSDTVELTANAKFFQQFLGFFRAIFGLAKHYEA